MAWVYSLKRKAIVLFKQDGKDVKVKFEIKDQTPEFFKAKGVMNEHQTDISYSLTDNELTITQAALFGQNYFLKCSDAKLEKKE